jgi:sec-independent protein translocase protein TatA
MDFFGIGFGEIVLILILALIVFGPGRLPEIARTMGRLSRNLKRMSSDFTTALTKEIDLEEEQKNLKKTSSDLKSDMKSIFSLDDEPRSHLDPSKSQKQTPAVTGAPTNTEMTPHSSTQTTPQPEKHE